MKYFTPDLYMRLQNLRDEAANQSWDQAVHNYATFLTGSRSRFPRSLQRILNKIPLHDADVLSMTLSRKDVLTLTIKPEQSNDLLILSYTLLDEPWINKQAIQAPFQTEPTAWLYDEVGLEEIDTALPNGGNGAGRGANRGPVTVYTHNILLSNGWEVRLKFRAFGFSQPQTFLPASSTADGSETSILPQSA